MRRQNLVGFALACLAVGLAAYLIGRGCARAPAPAAGPSAAKPVEPEPSPAPELTFDELAALLAARGRGPDAAGFGRDFMRRPRLKRIYDRFVELSAHSRAHAAPPPTARDFVRALRDEADFAALVAQASRSAALRALAEELGRKPGIAGALRRAASPTHPKTYGLVAPKPSPASARQVFGVSAPPSAARESTDEDAAGRTAAIAPSQGERGAAPRIEAHWVQEGAPADYMAVCRMLAGSRDCERVVAECRRDAACSRSLPVGAHGGVGASTATLPSPSPKDRLSGKK